MLALWCACTRSPTSLHANEPPTAVHGTCKHSYIQNSGGNCRRQVEHSCGCQNMPLRLCRARNQPTQVQWAWIADAHCTYSLAALGSESQIVSLCFLLPLLPLYFTNEPQPVRMLWAVAAAPAEASAGVSAKPSATQENRTILFLHFTCETRRRSIGATCKKTNPFELYRQPLSMMTLRRSPVRPLYRYTLNTHRRQRNTAFTVQNVRRGA